MSNLPKITAVVSVTIDHGDGDVTTVSETVSQGPAVIPLSVEREGVEAARAIGTATDRVIGRLVDEAPR